ncbi:hypothetical protein LWI29_026783 [Acer saccharum]|uniref:Nucleoside diphosphate kinase-like domain-containing protein n=1 Tax=Acer saccharum TaxID=4024 RepID=A0AA39W033_ACESA|nr:hypothetical protein LWI29_026783 [Acer saccharum]
MSLGVGGFRFLCLFVLLCVSFFSRTSSKGSVEKEKTLALIKPDGVSGNYTDGIKRMILESGFRILRETIVQLDEDKAANFYAEHSSRTFFSSLIKYMTSGPVLVMVLEKENAIADWRGLIGPTDARKAKITHPHSVRAMCGLDSEKNCVHGSDSALSAQREMSFFFKEMPSDSTKQEPREEFNDWPHGLLAIGTFGNNDQIKEGNNSKNQEIQNIIQEEDQETSSSMVDLQDFTPEEIGKFEKELTKLLRRKPINISNSEKDQLKENIANGNLPLDRFLNCPSSLEVDRRISNALLSSSDDHDHVDHEDLKDDDIDRTISVILGRCKDIRASDNSKKLAIGRKSISFLLKKMFVCSSGFAPQPSLRDSLQESRMERFLRIMLHKKINSQNATRGQSMKRYLEDSKQIISKKGINEDEQQEKNNKNISNNDGCKWVKTDSEYPFPAILDLKLL